jgi:hypothetical protein
MINTLLSRPSFVTQAVAVLGLTIAGILSHAPAEAAQYKISGKFAPEPIFAQDVGFFLPVAGGFFDGILELDDNTNTPTSWLVKAFNSQGSLAKIFKSEPEDYSRYLVTKSAKVNSFNNSSSIIFEEDYEDTTRPGRESISKYSLNLFLDQPNFVGNITSESYFYSFIKPYYIPSEYAPTYLINVIDGKVEKVVEPGVTSVPEPMSVLGLLAVGAFGAWKTNKQQQRFREV